MPNFKSISFKMAVLRGGGGRGAKSSLAMCVLSKKPMWNRVNISNKEKAVFDLFWIFEDFVNIFKPPTMKHL